jgi:hypothetical protein
VRYTKLAAEFDELQETLARVRAERLRIEADEPAEKRPVKIMASNDELRGGGVPEPKLHRVSWCQSKFGYIWTWGYAVWNVRKAARESAHV